MSKEYDHHDITGYSVRPPKYWYAAVLLLFLILLFAFSTAHAADLEVDSAGTSAANGCYWDVGGGEWYKDGTVSTSNYRIDSSAGTRCRMGIPSAGNPQSYYAEVGGTCTSSNAASGSWAADAGSNPAPNLTETTCPGNEPPAPPEQATSTIDQLQQNTVSITYIFMASMFFVVWLFKRKNI